MRRAGIAARIRARMTSWAASSEAIRRGRERRYRTFLELCRVRADERILDIFERADLVYGPLVDFKEFPDQWGHREHR